MERRRFQRIGCRPMVMLMAAAVCAVLPFSIASAGQLIPVKSVIQIEGSAGEIFQCAPIDGEWKPGTLVNSVLLLFSPTEALYQQRRRQLKKALGTSREKRSRRSFRRVSRALRLGREACDSIDGGGGGESPDPTPIDQANFDDQGNVTSIGKSRFEIPQDLPANISVGRTIYLQNCSDCHGEKVNRTFTFVRNRIAQAPMFFTAEEIPDPALANIIAYLNRFQP